MPRTAAVVLRHHLVPEVRVEGQVQQRAVQVQQQGVDVVGQAQALVHAVRMIPARWMRSSTCTRTAGIRTACLHPWSWSRLAAQRGVSMLALTDHDTTAGLAEARGAADQAGMRFIDGVEVTAGWRGQEIHIVGLGVDPRSATLQQHLAQLLADAARAHHGYRRPARAPSAPAGCGPRHRRRSTGAVNRADARAPGARAGRGGHGGIHAGCLRSLAGPRHHRSRAAGMARHRCAPLQ